MVLSNLSQMFSTKSLKIILVFEVEKGKERKFSKFGSKNEGVDSVSISHLRNPLAFAKMHFILVDKSVPISHLRDWFAFAKGQFIQGSNLFESRICEKPSHLREGQFLNPPNLFHFRKCENTSHLRERLLRVFKLRKSGPCFILLLIFKTSSSNFSLPSLLPSNFFKLSQLFSLFHHGKVNSIPLSL